MVKNPPANCQFRRCKRLGFDPWVGKIPWRRRKWHPTPIFLPKRESHVQRSLAGYPCNGKRVEHYQVTEQKQGVSF